MASISGAASAPGCQVVITIFAILEPKGVQLPAGSNCTSVPFIIDLPSVALAFTCPMAVIGYHVFIRRLNRLARDLAASGLIVYEDISTGVAGKALLQFKKRLKVPSLVRVSLLVGILVIGIFMYLVTYDHGQIFTDLARSDGKTSALTFRDGWWANYRSHPLLAFTWLAVGTVGAFYAFQAAWVYFSMFMYLRAAHSHIRINALTKWEDPDLGWKPMKAIVGLSYVGSINFAVSITAVLYILQRTGGRAGDSLVIPALLFGASLNFVFVIMLVVSIRRAQISAVDRDLDRIANSLDSEPNSESDLSDAALLVKADQLQAVRRYPLESRAHFAITLVPGLIAISKLLGDGYTYLLG